MRPLPASAVMPSLGHPWLMPRLEAFRAQHPEVELEFRKYHHDEDSAATTSTYGSRSSNSLTSAGRDM